MRIVIAAVGRARQGPFKELCDDYAGRLTWPVTFKEIQADKSRSAAARKKQEATRLSGAVPKSALTVALDAGGEALSSEALARRLEDWNARSTDLAFLIGGPDGLEASLRKGADHVLSLGSMTWPHLMARVMLVEQLYRASCILSGHPYHRQ